MCKIGILGGTFDPIHNGHLSLAKQAVKEFKLDKILFIPNHFPWMKSGRTITDDADRVQMVLAAIQDNPLYEISYIEIEAGGNSYTAETLLKLNREQPDKEFYFILGADSLFTLDSWYKPEIIFQNAILLAALRDDCDLPQLTAQKQQLEERYGGEIQLLHMDKMAVSSTFIRENFYTDERVSQMLPEAVGSYIRRKGLYKLPTKA